MAEVVVSSASYVVAAVVAAVDDGVRGDHGRACRGPWASHEAARSVAHDRVVVEAVVGGRR